MSAATAQLREVGFWAATERETHGESIRQSSAEHDGRRPNTEGQTETGRRHRDTQREAERDSETQRGTTERRRETQSAVNDDRRPHPTAHVDEEWARSAASAQLCL